MSILTVDQLAAHLAANAKSGKWISSHFQVQTGKGVFPVGVKCFGRWVQRLELCGLVSSVSEQKTQKAFKAEFCEAFNSIYRGV